MTNKSLVLYIITVLTELFLICTHSPAIAQDEPLRLSEATVVKSLIDMELEELMNVDVISASKIAQKVLEAPSSVTVFSRQELMSMGITSIEELLNFVPSFQATRESIYNQGYRVISRGQSTPQTSYNILFMINGERLNTDFTGGALAINHFITLANVKQVEVIRGPGSALYGTNAFTGVVNIITVTEGKEVFANRGNLGSKEFYTNLSHQGDSWKTSLFARYYEDKGQAYGKRYLTNDPNTTTVHDPRVGRDAYLSATWHDQLSIDLRHTERQLDGFLGGRGVSVDGINYFDGDQDMFALKYRPIDTEQGKLTLYSNYSTATVEQTIGYSAKKSVVQEFSLVKEREWQFGIDGHYSLNAQHELLAGLEWRRPELTDRYAINTDFATGKIVDRLDYKTGHRNILGLYLQDQYHVSETLEATLGVRYDRYSDFGSTTNPRLALVYTVTPETKFKLMYGQAFRAPSFTQLWTVTFGNPNLKPETVKTAEFAWTQQYSNVQTTLTYFRSRTQDRIDTVLSPTLTRVFANISSLDTAGWELETSFKIDNLFLRSTYTYLTKTVENPQNLSNQMFSVIANYPYGAWNFNVNGYYHDKMEQDITTPTGGLATLNIADYWVWNSALRYSWNKHLTLVGRAQNLGDKEFISPTKSPLLSIGLPNRGRTYSLGIEVQF